jgi:hypothetical protein
MEVRAFSCQHDLAKLIYEDCTFFGAKSAQKKRSISRKI